MANTYMHYHMDKADKPNVLVHRMEGEVYAFTISHSIVSGTTFYVTPEQARTIVLQLHDEVFDIA